MPPGTGFPFCRLVTTRRATVEVFYPASTLGTDSLLSIPGYKADTYLLTYSVALVRERTVPTVRSQLVGEVNANFLRIEGATLLA
jgi:hypothetical protein